MLGGTGIGREGARRFIRTADYERRHWIAKEGAFLPGLLRLDTIPQRSGKFILRIKS